MQLEDLIINDLTPVKFNDTIGDVKMMFSQLTYSHIPVKNGDIYVGCISETDAHCFESQKVLADINYSLEGFYVRNTTNWLDILEAFAQNDSNVMPVLDSNNNYLGYYELNDIIQLFNETPFFAESGGIIIVEKGIFDYSFSEVCQIIESNNSKIYGALISKMENDKVQITIKIGNAAINDVLQSFRRYGYSIVSGIEQDSYVESLKERSDYLKKYLDF
ncbi:CBS domain-containing protein [Paucihalobacter ruber]|uniref:CBS domain-containing protein n=1 Tax=Paucihalobacter ruber TaxID=2567861 RepID=A0A506PPL2_9FLAO|nr:CBS domain-containing protein [Paucihalobacter ruber]TPV35816.1 CBS domain-containing protein [Paucihalobacter ruber]